MIKRIYADNFRCLGNFEFRPQQLNLLLGENGSGKTSLFEVLLKLRDLLVTGLPVDQQFIPYDRTLWDLRDIQSFELDVIGSDGLFSYRLELRYRQQQAHHKPEIQSERLDFDGKPLFRYSDGYVQLFNDDHSPGPKFPFKSDRSFLPNLESQSARIQWFKNFMVHVSVFKLNPFAFDLFSQQDQRILLHDGSNFVSWLRHLSEENPRAKTQSERRLTEVIPGFENFRFQAMGDRKALKAVLTKEPGKSYELFFSQLSEGQRILSLLYSALYGLVSRSSVLCFDEPENFISLQEVQPWLQLLRDLVEESAGQALVISHHPEVIDYLAADSAFRFDRPNGDVVRVSPWIPDPEKIMKPSEILLRGG